MVHFSFLVNEELYFLHPRGQKEEETAKNGKRRFCADSARQTSRFIIIGRKKRKIYDRWRETGNERHACFRGPQGLDLHISTINCRGFLFIANLRAARYGCVLIAIGNAFISIHQCSRTVRRRPSGRTLGA